MWHIGFSLNPDQILSLKTQLDKAELKHVCFDIEYQFLVTILQYNNIKGETRKSHKINYMCLWDRVHTDKAKLNKGTNNDNFSHMHNTGKPQANRPMASHFNVIKDCGQMVCKEGNLYYDKYTEGVKNTYNNN